MRVRSVFLYFTRNVLSVALHLCVVDSDSSVLFCCLFFLFLTSLHRSSFHNVVSGMLYVPDGFSKAVHHSYNLGIA